MMMNSSSNATADVAPSSEELPPDMVFGEAQVISISVYSALFVASGVLNLRVLRNLLRARRHVGLSRLNHLLIHLVLADLLVSAVRRVSILCCDVCTVQDICVDIQKINWVGEHLQFISHLPTGTICCTYCTVLAMSSGPSFLPSRFEQG